MIIQGRARGIVIASRTATLLFIIFLVTGCAGVRLISEYDRETDVAVTSFHRKIEGFLISLKRNIGKEKARYEKNTAFYDGIKVDLSAIRVRAAAIPKNEITIQQIDLLIENVDRLEAIHKLGLTCEDIPPLRTAFNEICTAILKLELAKKRGRHGCPRKMEGS